MIKSAIAMKKTDARIRRLDKIGETKAVPSSRTVFDVKSQRWILDRLYRLMGKSVLGFSAPEEGLGKAEARGYNFYDVQRTAARIKCIDAYSKENTRTAIELEELARHEEDAGHLESAFNYYHRAALFYYDAGWGIFDSDDRELIWLNARLNECTDKFTKYGPYPMERVEIPFKGKSLSAILHLTPSRKNAPTIIVVPGMDDHKEGVVNPRNNQYIQRGLNCLAIDGPGQGESLIRKIWVDAENFAEAGSAAVDYLEKRPEVKPDKIGLYGHSMGSYWAALIASKEPRIKALATAMSCYYNKDHIFNEAAPNFRLRFMWMAGNLNDEEFDKMVSVMTLEGRERQIGCPTIIFHGELDHLTNTEETYNYFDKLGAETKELRIYENQGHGIGTFRDGWYMMVADWLRDRLMDLPPVQKRRIVLVDSDRREHPVDEEAIRNGFSFIRERSQ
ncbi:MAG TPA: alpha/beta fold hydrolase [Patescibacteria group bacterium]|nr:alpha/beta fold hydrolase [Patescibacteria group bacterium]